MDRLVAAAHVPRVEEARAAVDQPVHVDDRNISALPEADCEAIKQHDKAVQVAKREAVARQVESELSAWTAMQTRAVCSSTS